MRDLIIKYYKYFYEKVSGRVLINITKSDEKILSKFVISIGSNVGEEFMYKYMCYQFYYWHNLDTKFGKGNILLAWVIGDKAYGRYIINKSNHWKSYSTTLFEKFGVRRSDLITDANTWISGNSAHEDVDKLLYYNTDKGLLFCVDYTSMYNPKSGICTVCDNRNSCINIMKGKYPTIYNKRLGL